MGVQYNIMLPTDNGEMWTTITIWTQW